MSVLDRSRFGAILRVFSKSPEQVGRNIEQVLAAAKAAEELEIGERKVFSKILILVAADLAYPDYDCGETLPTLLQALPRGSKIEAHAIERGDLFCGVLNYGMAKLARAGVDYGLVMSHGAKDYLRPDTMEQLLKALEAGARVTSIAIEELSQSILEGRIANTFAIWDIGALQAVGGFDLRASQPRKNDLTAPYLRGWDPEEGDVYYPRAGVEEILPLIRLFQVYGPCIAPVVPAGEALWQEPDPVTDPEGWVRSRNKLGTKLARQLALAAPECVDLPSFLMGGVMRQYRTF